MKFQSSGEAAGVNEQLELDERNLQNLRKSNEPHSSSARKRKPSPQSSEETAIELMQEIDTNVTTYNYLRKLNRILKIFSPTDENILTTQEYEVIDVGAGNNRGEMPSHSEVTLEPKTCSSTLKLQAKKPFSSLIRLKTIKSNGVIRLENFIIQADLIGKIVIRIKNKQPNCNNNNLKDAVMHEFTYPEKGKTKYARSEEAASFLYFHSKVIEISVEFHTDPTISDIKAVYPVLQLSPPFLLLNGQGPP
jgi:hypothetical protein